MRGYYEHDSEHLQDLQRQGLAPQPNDDRMLCTVCGAESESLNDDDVCADCADAKGDN